MNVSKAIKISIIIPIYNCEQYLEECLQSVLNQTLKELEVLCIDDGSTDTSAEIIRKLQLEDGRIRLFQQENQGAGVARNLGIKEARGKYLAFLDSDDFYCDKDALEKMVAQCERLNVKAAGSLRAKLIGDERKKDALFQEFAGKPFAYKAYEYHDFQIDYDYQSFIFSTDVIREHTILFPEYRRFQDPPFMVQALFFAGQFTIVDTYLYCYRVPDVSARFNYAKMKDLLKGLRDNLQFASDNDLDKLFRKSLERLEYEYISIILHNLSKDDIETMELLLEINKIARAYLNQPNYVVRPLQQMLSTVIEGAECYEEKLFLWLAEPRKIALYGAGQMTRAFLAFLEAHGWKEKVEYIVVSDTQNNPLELEGISVVSVEDYGRNESFLFVTVCGLYQKEIEDILLEKGIKNYRLMDDVLLCDLQARMLEGRKQDAECGI